MLATRYITRPVPGVIVMAQYSVWPWTGDASDVTAAEDEMREKRPNREFKTTMNSSPVIEKRGVEIYPLVRPKTTVFSREPAQAPATAATDSGPESSGDCPFDASEALAAHIAGLRRYARALLGNSSDVDDLVQECLTRALERVRSWSNIKDVRAYLFAILHNVHIDRLAKQKRAGISVPLDGALPHLSVGPSQIGRLEVRDLSWALQQLPIDQRQVILLVGLEGITYQEVASLLSVPIGTVMSRLSRGRESLRRLMVDGTTGELRVVKQ